MLIPLAVLAVGAIFAGMLWYKPFFGDHHSMNAFFGIPAAHEQAAEGAAPAGEHAAVAAPEAEGHAPAAASESAEGHAPAATEEAEGHAAEAGKIGAIYMAPDNHVLTEAHESPALVKMSPFFAMLIGFVLAYWFYIVNPSLPGRLAASQRPLYLFLLNKWYFDELYGFLFVRPAMRLGRFLWKKGDGETIDGGINGIAMGVVPYFTRMAGRAQSGYLFHYAFAMVIGLVVLIAWVSLGSVG